jgi:hypothetical protein
MIDMEKVVKGLECCKQMEMDYEIDYCPDECPYKDNQDCIQSLCSDALEMLKKREPVQVIQREAMHMLFWCYGSCGVALTEGDKFCRMCGRAVKWT